MNESFGLLVSRAKNEDDKTLKLKKAAATFELVFISTEAIRFEQMVTYQIKISLELSARSFFDTIIR